ncbi:hypothetical protein THAOC_31168, partial [Thalassiosira oceanica]
IVWGYSSAAALETCRDVRFDIDEAGLRFSKGYDCRERMESLKAPTAGSHLVLELDGRPPEPVGRLGVHPTEVLGGLRRPDGVELVQGERVRGQRDSLGGLGAAAEGVLSPPRVLA